MSGGEGLTVDEMLARLHDNVAECVELLDEVIARAQLRDAAKGAVIELPDERPRWRDIGTGAGWDHTPAACLGDGVCTNPRCRRHGR